MQTTSTRSHLYALAAATSILSLPSVHAATYQWRNEGTNNNWSTALGDTNWYIDAGTTLSPWTDGNAATFDNATGETVTLASSIAPSSLTVSNNGNWTLNGTGSIAGSGSLSKSGTGTLTLANTTANSYSGGTQILGGTLSIGTGGTGANTSTTSALGSGSVNIAPGATLRLWIQNSTDFTLNNPLSINGGTILNEDGRHTLSGSVSLGSNGASLRSKWNGKNLTLSGVISGTGALTTGRPTDNSGHVDSTVILTGSNTFTGGTTVESARLQLGTDPVADRGGVGILRGTLTVNSPGILILNTTNALGYFNGQKVDTLNINNTTVRHASTGDNGWGLSYRFTGGTLETTNTGRFAFGGGSSVTTFANPTPANFNGLIYLRNDSTHPFTVADGAAFHDLQIGATLNQVTNNAILVKEGPGTLYLSGTTNHTGATNVNAGTFILGNTGTLPSSPVNVASGATFRTESVGKTLNSLTAAENATLALPANALGTTTVTHSATLPNGILNIAAIPAASLNPGDSVVLLSAGNLSGNPTLQASSAFGPTRTSGTLAKIGNEIHYTAVETGAELTWTNQSASGAAVGTWDLNTTANFDLFNAPETFQAFDRVTFNDTVANGSAKTVNLNGNIAPALIQVDNSTGNNYTLDANTVGSGSWVGQTDLRKTGSGSLILGSNLQVLSTAGHFDLQGGTLDLGAKTLSRQAQLTLNGNASLINGNLPLQQADFIEGTISASLQNNPVWTKTGTTTTTITSNSNLGAGTISAGNLQVGNGGTSGTLGTDSVTIEADGTLTFLRSDNGYTIPNSLSGSGRLVINGTNNGTTNQQSHYPVTGNNQDFSGSILITNSRMQSDTPADVGTASITTGTNGQWYVTAGTYTNPVDTAGVGWGETIGLLGSIRLGGSAVLNGPIHLTGNARISAHASTGVINGPIHETGGSRNLELGGTSSLSTLTLGGDSTYSGTTTIQNANVILNGSLSSNLVTVNAGSTLQGSGDIYGSLTFAAGATTLGVNASNPERLAVAGTLTLSGVTSVNLVVGQDFAPGGTVTLATASQINGLPANLALANPSQYRQGLFTVNPTSITVDIGAKSITWTGATNGNWDAGTTANFTEANATAFYQGDTVRFDDSSTTGSVSLVGTLNPSKIVIDNNSTTYTFNGTGTITGGGNLVKSGTGTLQILAGMPYTGTTHIQGGTVIIDGNRQGNRQANRQTVTLESGSTLEIRGVNPIPTGLDSIHIVANHGSTLRVVTGMSPSTDANTNSHAHLNNVTLNGATIELPYSGSSIAYNGESFQLNGDLTVGGSSPSSITTDALDTAQGIALAGSRTFHIDDVTGDDSADLLVQAEIENSDSNNGALVKTGTGTLAFMKANSYSAGTTVSQGTLHLGNDTTGSATGTGPVTVATGATLTGNGTASGTLTVNGTISPSSTLHTGATTINGAYHCDVSGTQNDRLIVTGDLILNAGSELHLQTSSLGNQAYIIATYTGTLTGTFSNIENLPPGFSISYAYNDGNSSNNIAVVSDSLTTPYDQWAQAYGVDSATPDTDSDSDGIPNAIEFVIGGIPSGTGSNSNHLLPTAEVTSTHLVFTFRRTAESTSVPAQVEWSTGLSTWTPAIHNQDGITIEEEPNGFGSGINRVTARIPRTLAAPGSRLFARLKVEIN